MDFCDMQSQYYSSAEPRIMVSVENVLKELFWSDGTLSSLTFLQWRMSEEAPCV